MFRIRNKTDLTAGLFVIGVAVFFLATGTGLRFGTMTRMGAGFFPTVLAWTLLALGVGLCIRSLTVQGDDFEWPRARPLVLIALGPIAFGLLVTKIGLFLTVAAVGLTARLAMKEVWKIDSFLLPLGLAAFCSLVFVTLLGQPIPLWP